MSENIKPQSKIWYFSTLAVVACFALVLLQGCFPENNEQLTKNSVKILEGDIGGKRYYVPEPYFVMRGLALKEDTIYIRAVYPDFAPLAISTQELWNLNQQHRKIDVLAKHLPNASSLNEYFEHMNQEVYKAFEVVGEEHGLTHMKQPEEYNQDNDDLWVAKKNGVITSYINCSNASYVNVPQCKKHFYWRNFRVNVNFNMRLLPQWKEIHNNVLNLLESFEERISAQQFLNNTSYPNTFDNHGR